ncbi:MAG: hypothetical protein K6C32_01900 [Bacilli bacterium]|nr:hypothetical protein [Bacilli bacterium]
MKEVKHYKVRCPICGNTDFVAIKEPIGGFNWTIESETLLLGCTKCFLILPFNEAAIKQCLEIEKQNQKVQEEIKVCEEDLSRLKVEKETKYNQLNEKKLEVEQQDSLSIRNKIEWLKDDISEIDQRMMWAEKEIQRLKDGGEDDVYCPPLNKSDMRFDLLLKNHKELLKRIEDLEKEIKDLKTK